MNQFSLSDEEVVSVKSLLAEVSSQYTSVDEMDFLLSAPLIAHELPRRVRAFLNHFKHAEPAPGACVVSTHIVDDRKIGLTPTHWKARPQVSPTLEEEILFVLFSSLLGEVIGWATQQDGFIVHDVLPIKEDENEQISTGSQQTIWWHNEDAFHPYRGDYVALMCLRNPENVPTTLASVHEVKLSPHQTKILFEPRFVIRPDESHAEKNRADSHQPHGDGDGLIETAYEHIRRMQQVPQKLAVLYGDPKCPYIRIDPYFMDRPTDDDAQAALNALIRQIDNCLVEVVLQPGDYLFVDNYRAVHGRKPFRARYDGTDRWLKRVNITRDLRKSRNARPSCKSRIIF
jgi:Fe(II)/alpha-ketoglutarate-dependent arginine beta-hydroxylase